MAEASDTRPPLLNPGDGGGQTCRRLRRLLGGTQAPAQTPSVTRDMSLTPQIGRELTRVATVDAPHSVENEVRFFLKMGIPLSLSALLNWGLPSVVGMVFAGHTDDSAHLQAAVGYGRVWFNVTVMVPTISLMQYCWTMLPSCIGAKRQDRVNGFLCRSVVMTILFMSPMWALQFVSGRILQAASVPADIAAECQTYNIIMIITNMCQICGMHMETLVTNWGYAKSTTVVSFSKGSLQVLCSYIFIYRLQWGMVGNALGGILVETGGILIYGIVILAFGLWRSRKRTDGVVASQDAENQPFLSCKDVREYFSLTAPSLFTNLGGWMVFEFQMLALANIRDIPPDALAAGAAWVQLEGMLAASQQGWLTSCGMRSVSLLGKEDPGASKAYAMFQCMASSVVALTNVLLFLARHSLCKLLSNDDAVQGWLEQIFWVLIIHSQSRVCSASGASLFIPAGKGSFQTFWTFFSFYVVASPIAGVVAMTDLVTDSIANKMFACVGLSSIAQILQAFVFYTALCRMDWQQVAATIRERVNNDSQQNEGALSVEAGESGQGGTSAS